MTVSASATERLQGRQRTYAGTAGAIDELVAGRAGVGCVGAMEDGLRGTALPVEDAGTLRVAMIASAMLEAIDFDDEDDDETQLRQSSNGLASGDLPSVDSLLFLWSQPP